MKLYLSMQYNLNGVKLAWNSLHHRLPAQRLRGRSSSDLQGLAYRVRAFGNEALRSRVSSVLTVSAMPASNFGIRFDIRAWNSKLAPVPSL